MSGLLPGWEERLEGAEASAERAERRRLFVPSIDVGAATGRVWTASDAAGGRELLATMRALPISAIAVEAICERTEATLLRDGREWADIRALTPRFVALAALTLEGNVVEAVLDLRDKAVLEVLGEVLRLRVTWISHGIKELLFALWNAGLDAQLGALYDTYLAAAALDLGRHHKRAAAGVKDEAERIRAEQGLQAEQAHLLSLAGQCEHYGLPVAPGVSGLLPQDLTAAAARALTGGAVTTLCLFLRQRGDLTLVGLDHHLQTVEFPFAVANARVEWHGVKVDSLGRERVREAAGKAADFHEARLAQHGVTPPGSRGAFVGLIRKHNLWNAFMREGHISTEDDVLEAAEGLHPAIRDFRLYRRYSRLAGEEWLSGVLDGSDGRLHPRHQQLGAATGRNTCSMPNIVGIGRIMRPVVTAPAGRAIAELDYSQIEVGVAAAEHGDRDLIAAYNSGDVYAAMALRFYAAKLSAEDQGLGAREFRLRHPDLRDRTKTLVLAILYNIQAPAIAKRFGISEAAAEKERLRFLDLYPVLRRRLEESSAYGKPRGFASVVSGLRRSVVAGSRNDSWTENVLRNTPIQGSAAVVFKRAVIELDRAFQETSTWLILPVHDAIVIECDLELLHAVADEAAGIMGRALRAVYPVLDPKVEVNKRAPWCWNKDGHADSLEQFLRDPDYRIGAQVLAANVDHDEFDLVPTGWDEGARLESVA